MPQVPAPPSADPASNQRVPAELFERFLENQSKDIALRTHELELEKQKDAHSFEFGKAALDAQERDRHHERECRRNQHKDRYRLIILIVVVLAILIVAALYLGSEKLALEVAKGIGYISAGLLGGYGLAKKNQADESPQD